MKEQLRKFGTLILILALCLTSIGTTKVQAASKPSRPSVSLVKRSKTQAKIKIKKRGKATGYQIAVKTSKRRDTVLSCRQRSARLCFASLKHRKCIMWRCVHSVPKVIASCMVNFQSRSRLANTKDGEKPKPKATATPEPTVTPEATQIPESTVTPSEAPSDAPAPSATAAQ